MEKVDAALRYAARGWPVFPCRGKIPLTPHGFHDASTDAATIEAWWRENPDALISVATGRASRVVVLDIDVKHAGPNGWDALEEIGALPLPDTPMASTPSGGTHVFFDPGELDVPLSVGKIGAQLDVRGERSCCTLPTPGTAYRWDPHKNLRTTPLAPAPAWLVPPTAPPVTAAAPAYRPPTGEISPYGASAINGAVRAIYARAGRPAIDDVEPRGVRHWRPGRRWPASRAHRARRADAGGVRNADLRPPPTVAARGPRAKRQGFVPRRNTGAAPCRKLNIRPAMPKSNRHGGRTAATTPTSPNRRLPVVCAASLAGKAGPAAARGSFTT